LIGASDAESFDSETSQQKRWSHARDLLNNRRCLQLKKTEKVVVTEKYLDDWIAQLYGLTIDDVPRIKPREVPDHVYGQLRKYVKR